MKKLIAVFTLLLASEGFAKGNLLHFENKSKLMGGQSHFLDVYQNGQVVHRSTRAVVPETSPFLVTTLQPDQIRRLNRLAIRASRELLGFERSNVKCFAPSTHTETYTALDGSVFLRSGAMCDGGYRVNLNPAARRLVRVLDVLERAAHERLPIADIETQIDQAL